MHTLYGSAHVGLYNIIIRSETFDCGLWYGLYHQPTAQLCNTTGTSAEVGATSAEVGVTSLFSTTVIIKALQCDFIE